MPLARLLGIGIDLVSWKRIKRFLASHSPEGTARLLTPAEQILFQSTPDSLDFFARSFAAKEAYFKACGGTVLGEEGFREIEIVRERDEGFHISNDPRTAGEFFPIPEGIGAKVLVWQE